MLSKHLLMNVKYPAARTGAWLFITCKQVVAPTYASSYVCETLGRNLSKVSRCLTALDVHYVAKKLDPPPGYFATGKQVVAPTYTSGFC
jgi:hypothetical protein